MAHTRQHRRQQNAEKRSKNLLKIASEKKKIKEDRKVSKLTSNLRVKNKRGRDTGKLKKQLANIPVQERSAPVNKKAKGLSSLGKDYKQQELDLAKKATKRSAEINKARYPKMGTYTNPNKSTTDNKGSKTNVKKGKSSIEAKNRARFGDAHVDKLKAKQVDFKKMRKGNMSKADFIKKYPKSITAQKAKGLRK
tara:strand:+ start:35 stop:616 length:582 start_codon:yes stop_codon:yes gene_type:complete